jgi:hypothetical protein
MPASRSVVSALVRELGDLLSSLKAGPAARQPHHGHRDLAAPCAAGGTAHSSPWVASPMGFEQQLDQWREFYLAVAGAAAVLLGLVFIALSLHLEKVEAPGVPVLGLGSQALTNLIYVLLLSLGMLVPYRPPVLPRHRGLGGCRGRAQRLDDHPAAGTAGLRATLDDQGLGGSRPAADWLVCAVGGGRRGRHRPPAVRPVPAGRRERGADRQRDSEHLGPAGVRSHPRT